MSKADGYRVVLRGMDEWDAYLLQESGLPGPRGNLELAQVVADEGDQALFQRYIAYTPDMAPVNSPYEFLAFCGIVGLGRLLAEGDRGQLPTLRQAASDPRWRLREAVAMALQRWGDVDMEPLLGEMQQWADDSRLEQRAAVAALCEPRLLRQAVHARAVLQIVDRVTASIESEDADHRRSQDLLILRQGLGYAWSVAVVALPAEGKALMEKWLVVPDKDVQWLLRENLKKARLARMDAGWVTACRIRMQ